MTEKELANLLSLKDLAQCSNTQFASDEMVAVHQTGANFAHIGYQLVQYLLGYTVLVEGAFLLWWSRPERRNYEQHIDEESK